MSNDIPSDAFSVKDLLRQVSDAFNEGLEQAKRQSECKIRRFYTTGRSPRRDGAVFLGSQVVVYNGHPDNLQIFSSFDAFRSHNTGNIIQWIDPEPEASK